VSGSFIGLAHAEPEHDLMELHILLGLYAYLPTVCPYAEILAHYFAAENHFTAQILDFKM